MRICPLLAVALAVALGATLLASPAPAAAKHPSVDPPKYDEVVKGGAQAILAATDSVHFSYKTQEVLAKLSVHEPDGKLARTITMKMYQDGSKRLIRMLDPPEVKGMGILIKDSETMYVYVPEFDKVRLVASHARKQTFLASDFNYDDMGMAALAPVYDAAIEKETADEVVLMLTVKAGQTSAYPKLRLFVDKKTVQTKKQEYFDADGHHVRTQIRSDMKSFESPDYAVQSRLRIIDHANHDHWTELVMDEFKADHEVPSRLFRKRTLVRGE